MEKEIKLEDCYDEVSACKKCNTKYGYDLPSKFIKFICGKRIKVPGYKDNGLCPICDPQFKEKPKALRSDGFEKPKGLYTSDSMNKHPKGDKR
jgi:hypothetical protein